MSHMPTTLYIDSEPIERINALESNADEVLDNYFYTVALDESDVSEAATEHITKAIEIAEFEAEKKVLTQRINEQIKLLQARNKQLESIVRTGRIEMKDTCYKIVDFSIGKYGIYDQRGFLIQEGSLGAKERQRTIFSKDGTNG